LGLKSPLSPHLLSLLWGQHDFLGFGFFLEAGGFQGNRVMNQMCDEVILDPIWGLNPVI